MESMVGKKKCPYAHSGSHKHQNEIDTCQICFNKNECKIMCGQTKNPEIKRICITCWDKFHS